MHKHNRGDVFTFGLGACGQLGHKNRTSLNLPKRLDLLSTKPLRSYAAGYYHNVALTTNGQLYSWGYLSDDHIGLSEGDEYISNPSELDTSAVDSKKIVTVAAGGWHSCCITSKTERKKDRKQTHKKTNIKKTERKE